MSYGIQVLSSQGLRDLTALQTVRVVHRLTAATTNGSAMVPQFSATRGQYYMLPSTDGLQLPATAWDEAGKLFTWWRFFPAQTYSAQFTVFFMETL